MPPPKKPGSSGTAGQPGLSAHEIDPDYLYFLRHLRPEGRSYAVEIPSKDGSSAPHVVRYEETLAAPNAGSSTVRSEGGTRSASSPMEEDPSAAVEVSSGAAFPPAGPDGEASVGAAPVEGAGVASPKAEPAWYDAFTDIDEDYRYFLQHSRVVNDHQLVFEVGNFSMTLGEAPSVRNLEVDDEDEDEEEEEDEDVEAVSALRDSSVGTKEKNDVKEKVKEEVDDYVKIEKDGCVKDEMESDTNEGMHTTESDLQLVNVMELEMMEEVYKEKQPLNGMTPEPEPWNRDASSGRGYSAMPHNASELEGVVWPTHIIERPESDFKRKLMKVLIKPFKLEEFDELYAIAADRTPVIKERRTRRRVVYYPWEHEMGKSYFDSYPDLANQVEGENSYPNRLALLRGFFFWLENVGHDEQFRPWRGDHQRYRVIYSNMS